MGESKQKPLLTKKITKSRRTSANKHLEDNILRADETEAELSTFHPETSQQQQPGWWSRDGLAALQEPAAPPLIGSKSGLKPGLAVKLDLAPGRS